MNRLSMRGPAPVPPADKLFPRDELFRRFARPRDFRLVFTNGCFDILHRGHVEYLTRARSLGDFLVVGVNTDRSVRRLKGESRPVNPEEDRALVLAGMGAVDAVVLFGEDTPIELIRGLLPDVLIKGGDYAAGEVVGGSEVVAAGGEVVIAPLVPGRSTTAIIHRAASDSHG